MKPMRLHSPFVPAKALGDGHVARQTQEPSCAGSTRASITLRNKACHAKRWIAGSSPAMTPGESHDHWSR
jgi:hypothetical protein